jgi:hypothetical protein
MYRRCYMSEDNDKIFNEEAPKYPERASGKPDLNSMLMAYAGPQNPPPPMMAVYAGPAQMTQNPMGLVYAGPNGMSSANGFMNVPSGADLMEEMKKASEAQRKEFKFCTECGVKNKRSNKFCTDCGAPFSPETMKA